MTRPHRHLGVADENRQGRYPASNASVERWTRTAASRAAREAWAGIALGLFLVAIFSPALGVPLWLSAAFAVPAAGASLWATWRATP